MAPSKQVNDALDAERSRQIDSTRLDSTSSYPVSDKSKLKNLPHHRLHLPLGSRRMGAPLVWSLDLLFLFQLPSGFQLLGCLIFNFIRTVGCIVLWGGPAT